MPAPKGKRLRSSSTSKIHPSPYTLIASTCTPATWTTRNSSGASNASSMPACTTTLSRCSSARPRTAPSASGKACEPSPENRGGNTPPWPHSLLPLHGNLPLRCRVGLLRGARGAVRQSGRLLHLQRCPCRLRPPAGAAIPGDVAGAGFAAIARSGGARPRTWPVRPGRAGLVGEEVSRILPRFALPAGRGFARAAAAPGRNPRPPRGKRQGGNLFLHRAIAPAVRRPRDCFCQRVFRRFAGGSCVSSRRVAPGLRAGPLRGELCFPLGGGAGIPGPLQRSSRGGRAGGSGLVGAALHGKHCPAVGPRVRNRH